MTEEDLFRVNWIPPIKNFFDYIRRFRELSQIPLGGTRRSSQQYSDPTTTKVLSVGPNDSRSSLPQRISLSNFKLGIPITSYGCIYRSSDSSSGEIKVRYLLIQRKNSVGYVDLLRGCYRESQLFLIIQDLPLKERERLLEYDFDTLWLDFHLKPGEGEAYEYAKGVYQRIRPYLPRLLELIPPIDPEGKNLWLFPKGKPNWMCEDEDDLFDGQLGSTNQRSSTPESPLDCALREFREETNGLEVTEEGRLIFANPIIERYLGSNSKNYQTNYFVYQTETLPVLRPSEKRETPIREVSLGEVERITWVPIEELSKYLRDERMELIRYIEENRTKESPEQVALIWRSSPELPDEPTRTARTPSESAETPDGLTMTPRTPSEFSRTPNK